MRYIVILALSYLFSYSASAQDNLPPNLEPVPDGSPTASDQPPTQKKSGTPQVAIISRLDGTYEEHRINGQLYMIRVLPKKGPPYFLIDSDGDGTLESRYNSKDERVLIPGWVVLDW